MNASELRRAVESALLAPDYDSAPYVNDYLKVHMNRFAETVRLLQLVMRPGMRIVDVGSYGSLVPALRDILGASDVTLTEPFQGQKPASEDSFLRNARNGARYPFHVDRFDIEGRFPYEDGRFDIVIFTEVLEHLSRDPAQTMSEINRITKPGGYLVLSTPNCASVRSILRILRGGNPNIYPVYQRRPSTDRHNHEYVPWEVRELLKLCGFTSSEFKTIDVYHDQQFGRFLKLQLKVVLRIGSVLSLGFLKARERGDTIFALALKTGGVQERYPGFLYARAERPAQ
ncbi:MAG TPA: class I SAM-dependent methyltransferase [Candidatus Binatia bacterium]|nr:class I SAM-dependent methyltransferase [Candidatus Binatia bacterium]